MTVRTFGPCSALPAGGSGSYSYAWTVVSTDTAVIITAPTSQATSFNVSPGEYYETTAHRVRCTVTDTLTRQIGLVDVLIYYTIFENDKFPTL